MWENKVSTHIVFAKIKQENLHKMKDEMKRSEGLIKQLGMQISNQMSGKLLLCHLLF